MRFNPPNKSNPSEDNEPQLPEIDIPELHIDPANELWREIQELEKSVSNYSETFITPLSNSINKITRERKEIIAHFEQVLAKMREEHSETMNGIDTEFRNQRNDLYMKQDELANLKRKLAGMKADHTLMLKQKAAEAALDKIEADLNFLMMGAPFAEAILPYQYEDLKFMLAAFEMGKSGVLNANDMGLGKTFESTAFIYCIRHLYQKKFGVMPQILWLTAPALIKQTVREIHKWTPDAIVQPIEGSWTKSQREIATTLAVKGNAICVANYEQVRTNTILSEMEWDIVICDEVSKLKGGANKGKPSDIWLRCRDIIKKCKFFLPLSGTPIQNKPSDMWAYLHLFNPVRFPTLARFENEYCYGWPKVKVNFEALINTMKDQVIRKSKPEVLKDLPERTRVPYIVDMTAAQRKLYVQMRDAFYIKLDNDSEDAIAADVIIAWIIRLWQIAVFPGMMEIENAFGVKKKVECNESGVLDEAEDLTEQLLEAGEQVVIWSAWFKPPLYEMQRRIQENLKTECGIIAGDNSKDHDDIVQKFNSGELRAICINMKSGGMGLDGLQVASHAIMLDRWWNPAVNDQAESRLHRKGQKNAVTIHNISADDSVYQYIQAKIDQKESMTSDIMEDPRLRKTGRDWADYLRDII